MPKYEIFESDHKKFLEINGTRSIGCPLEKNIKDGSSIYYYIECNGKFYNDFPFYLDENNIGIFFSDWTNVDLINAVFDKLKEKYDKVSTYIPAESEKVTDEFMRSNYNVIDMQERPQGKWIYNKYIFKLK